MTPSELKRNVERGADGHFFTRNNMKFAGDTMRNYGVRAKPVTIETYSYGEVQCWELYRKKPVKHGLADSAYFDIKTFAEHFKKED
jgi:hypothetical protein